MTAHLQEIVLVRHGETAWSRSGKHTGRSDISLTAKGIAAATLLGPRLEGRSFDQVWSSPSIRAQRTCGEAGFAKRMIVRPDLAEWDYGAYEGLTTAEILRDHPGWKLFRDGCPDGEHAEDVAARADRIVTEARARPGDVLIFSSAHLLRVLAARWLGELATFGAKLILGTASISILGFEHDATEPVIRQWNAVAGSM